jgi:hypothetical protein
MCTTVIRLEISTFTIKMYTYCKKNYKDIKCVERLYNLNV